MLNSKFPLIKSENHPKKSELPLIWGVKRRTTRKRIVLRLTPQTSGNSLFLESFSLYMSGNLLFNVQNHSFLSGLQEFHSFGEWNFHSFTFREYRPIHILKFLTIRSSGILESHERRPIARPTCHHFCGTYWNTVTPSYIVLKHLYHHWQ